jgi:hypothetical protein
MPRGVFRGPAAFQEQKPATGEALPDRLPGPIRSRVHGRSELQTEAALLLLDWLWWSKSRGGEPLVHVRGGIQLADFLEQPVPLRTRFEPGNSGLQPGFLGCNIFLKRVGNRSATLHDTTSCLRVLTVGVRTSDPTIQMPGRRFQSEQSRSGTVIFQTRPRRSETGVTKIQKRTYCEHRTKVVQNCHRPSNPKSATARLSRSRIPAIRSTYYVRNCPAYRRRILHG